MGCGYGGWGGYGYPYAYGAYGYPAGSTYVYAYDNPATSAAATPQLPADGQTPPADQLQSASDHIARGEQFFEAGQYQDAVRAWQHALVDNPTNGGVLLLMAQALFAQGQYEPAANTVQMAMQALPENEWGTVVKNYAEIYPQIENYTNQLKALEKARDAKPDDPALRFLLGYHFGYLGYPKHAVREFDKAMDLAPRDAGSQKLREIFAPQAGLPPRAATPPPPVPDGEQGPAAAPAEATPQAAPLQTAPDKE